MFWDLSVLEVGAALAAVMTGAHVQATIGMGLGLVLVPVLALVAPATLPAVPLLLALPLSWLMVLRERGSVDRRGVPRLIVGRLLGTVGAVWLLLILTGSALEILFGVVIVTVAALSALQPTVQPTPATLLGAGFTAGLFATTASIGGPPVALLYQSRPGPELRATLGVVFFLGTVLSLGGVVVAGRLGPPHPLLAVAFAPAMLAGLALSRRLARVLDERWLRPAVLLLAVAGGVLAIVRGLAG